MIRLRIAVAVVLCALWAPSLASAQVAGRRPVRAGDVTGLEMGLEGSLRVTRGETLRWLLTIHEVVGLQGLRPAPQATVRVLTSFSPGAAAAEVTTDAYGRAQVEVAVPDDAPDSFGTVIEIRKGSVQRRFELRVGTDDARELRLTFARTDIALGGYARFTGRLVHRATGRPLGGEAVALTPYGQQNQPLGAPVRVRTDASGAFSGGFRVGRDAGGLFAVRARTGRAPHELETSAQLSVRTPMTPPLLVQLAPDAWVARPGQQLQVDVVVRTPRGAPVANATLMPDWRNEVDARRRIRTDARGRARIPYQVPDVASIQDVSLSVSAQREGVGVGSASATVRIAGQPWAAALAVEGGTFPEATGGYVYVRVVRADGAPAPQGIPVELTGPRLAAPLRGTTDADGVARVDVTLAALPAGAGDPCGGGAATSLVASIEGGRAQVSACIPIDADAAARVRVSPVVAAAGAHVRVEVERAPAARGLPVAVTLLVREEGAMRALSAHVVGPNETITEVTLPADAVGHIVVRARPLFGDERVEVRGGSASLWATAGARAELRAHFEGAQACAETTGGVARTFALRVVPVDEADALVASLRPASFLPSLSRDAGAAGEQLVGASLALVTPLDVGAPAVLRGAQAVAVPAPTSPEQLGLLRDPFRARARFVSGRLALVFQAIEAQVEGSIPERIADVGVQGARGWEFNALLLDAVSGAGGLGDGGATGLGGEPLTIAQFQSLDPQFTYDNVARRITRKRLFSLLLALRAFVAQNGLDLRWSWRGDPVEWLARLPQMYVPNVGNLQPTQLVDGWGHPFVLRPATRAGFTLLQPVQGYELVSAGPDGRLGSADDVLDPTARVLPTTSLYAQAVGEDALVARLHGVELGRATVDLAANLFGVGRPSVPAPNDSAAQVTLLGPWTQLPSRVDPDEQALALRRPAITTDGELHVQTATDRLCVPIAALADDAEPRTWALVATADGTDGSTTIATASVIGGAQVIVDGTLPARVRAREDATLRVHVTNLSTEAQHLAVRFEGSEQLGAQVPASLDVGAEESVDLDVIFRGVSPGASDVRIVVDGGARRVAALGGRVSVDAGDHPVIRRASALAWNARGLDTQLTTAPDARGAEARVIVLSAAALAADPELAPLERNDPALAAWSVAASGGTVSPALRANLLRVLEGGQYRGADASLSTAAALLPLAALGADDAEAQQAIARLRGELPNVAQSGSIPTRAAVLAALALGGVADPADEEEANADPVAQSVSTLRASLRAELNAQRAEPSVMARMAAALLAADPRDGHGLVLLDLVSEHLRSVDGDGTLVVPSEAARSDGEALVATLALAVAAHQAEREELAQRLVSAALRRVHVAGALGGEAPFWLLACGAYGVLGAGEPTNVRVTIDGAARTVTLENGRAVIPVPNAAGTHSVQVRAEGSAGVLARAEVAFARPFAAENALPVTLTLEGDAGRAPGVAALELAIVATGRVDVPVLDLQLPAGVRADEPFLGALRSADGVLEATTRAPGYVRIRLRRLDREQRILVPLPLRWTVSGRLQGLAVSAFSLDHPEIRTVLAPRELVVGAAPAP